MKNIFKEQYPELYKETKLSIPNGWETTVLDFSRELKIILADNILMIESFKILQIKAKNGSLRVYYSLNLKNKQLDTDFFIKELEKLISKYHHKTKDICQECGEKSTGQYNYKNRIFSWCNKHIKQ